MAYRQAQGMAHTLAMKNKESIDAIFGKVSVAAENQQKQEFRGLLETVLPMLNQGGEAANEAISAVGGCIQFELLEDDPRIEAIIKLALNLELPDAHRERNYQEATLEDLCDKIRNYLKMKDRP